MGALRSRLSFANVISAIALFIALGAGAYAAQKVPNDSILPRDLNFALGADGRTKTGKLAGISSYQPVAKTTVRVDDQGGVMVISGAVEVDNSANATPAEVTLRALMNGKPEEGEFTTIPANSIGSGLALMLCDDLPAGTYNVTLQAQGSGVTFTDRSLSVETAPQI